MTEIPVEMLESFRALITNDKKEIKDKTIKKSNPDKFIDDFNEVVLENERQKQRFKRNILILVSVLTSIQLVFFNAVVVFVVMACTTKMEFFKNLSVGEITEVLGFLKYYIGATVVELLGMLLFIIRYVFTDREIKKKILQKNSDK